MEGTVVAMVTICRVGAVVVIRRGSTSNALGVILAMKIGGQRQAVALQGDHQPADEQTMEHEGRLDKTGNPPDRGHDRRDLIRFQMPCQGSRPWFDDGRVVIIE